MVTVPGIPLLSWEAINTASRGYREPFCSVKEHVPKRMNSKPINPNVPFEFYECPLCQRKITISDIAEAFKKAESRIENQLQGSIGLIFGGNGNIHVESLEYIGQSRTDSMLRPVTNETRIDVINALKEEVSLILKVQLIKLTNLFSV